MNTKTFTVRAENPAGETYVAITINVRKGYCMPVMAIVLIVVVVIVIIVVVVFLLLRTRSKKAVGGVKGKAVKTAATKTVKV